MTPWNGGSWQQGRNGGWGQPQWSSGSKPAGGQWWTCNIPGCVTSLKSVGHKPRCNHPKSYQCSHCELPWDFAKMADSVEVDRAKEALLAKVKAGPSGMTAMLSKTQQSRMTTLQAASTTSIKVQVPADVSGLDGEDETMEDPTTELALPQEYSALTLQLKVTDAISEEWAAETVAARFLPKKNATDLAEIEKISRT